eukprot:scaffold7232_cov624-Prasinococcus_capsulatus_cf.AAC.4
MTSALVTGCARSRASHPRTVDAAGKCVWSNAPFSMSTVSVVGVRRVAPLSHIVCMVASCTQGELGIQMRSRWAESASPARSTLSSYAAKKAPSAASSAKSLRRQAFRGCHRPWISLRPVACMPTEREPAGSASRPSPRARKNAQKAGTLTEQQRLSPAVFILGDAALSANVSPGELVARLRRGLKRGPDGTAKHAEDRAPYRLLHPALPCTADERAIDAIAVKGHDDIAADIRDAVPPFAQLQ